MQHSPLRELSVETIVEALVKGILITDSGGRIAYANSACAEIIQVGREVFLGRPLHEAFPDARDTLGQALRLEGLVAESLRSGQPLKDMLAVIQTSKRSTRVVSLNIVPYSDGEPPRSGGVISLIDVTEQHEAEEALRRSRAQLAEAQDLAHLGSWEWDIVADRVSWSDELYRIYGLAPGSGEMSYDRYLSYVHPADREHVNAVVRRCYESREPFELEHRLIRSDDGRTRVLHARGRADMDSEGRPVRMFGTALDITERREAEEAVRRLNRELELRVEQRTLELASATSELDAYSYSVAHNLRTPLRAIDGYASALLEREASRLDADGRDFLDRIRKAAERMAILIEDVQSLSLAIRAKLSREDLDLTSMARQIARTLAEREPGRRIEVRVEDGLSVEADARLAHLALEQLLSNAFKFSASRSEARIEVGRTERDGERVYYVRDNGVGFSMSHADKLFQPFQRLHSSEFEGSGLGLATVARVVERHGGHVWAESQPDQGASFYFKL